MSFVSVAFLVFLMCLFPVYFLIGRIKPNYQWSILLVASYVFYAYTSFKLVVFLLFSTVTTWLFPLMIEKQNQAITEKLENAASDSSGEEKKKIRKRAENKKKLLVVACVFCNLFLLAVLKYYNFFRSIFGFDAIRGIVLPLGISFYTFQSIGYCVDVYRGMENAERNFLKYALFVSYFPQISQGPIGIHASLSPQLLAPHVFHAQSFKTGAERFLIGLFKKLVIANNLGNYVNAAYSSPSDFSGIGLAFATVLYAVQLYADFSGYMDMACGVSECLGIQLSENFNTPYFSHSITEFWRRWHITLGAWFRDYLYYSVLRSKLFGRLSKVLRKRGYKKAAQKTTAALGLLITWFLIGLWHGAGLNYICYGLYHGFFVILAVLLADFYSKMKQVLHINEDTVGWKFFQIARTFFIVCAGYVLFRSDGIGTAGLVLDRMLNHFWYDGWSVGIYTLQFDKFYWICMAGGIVLLLLIDVIDLREPFLAWLNRQKLPLRWGILYVFMISVLCMVLFSNLKEAGAGNFIYFNF